MKKVNSLISYENIERTNFFSTQARSEILYDLEFTYPEELYPWVSFDLDNSLTFSKKLELKNIICWFATIIHRNSEFFRGKLQLNGFFEFYIHSATRTPFLVGLEQLLDFFKKARFEICNSLICNYSPMKTWFFSRQATSQRFSLLKFTYMVELGHKFWLEMNKSLTFWKKNICEKS